MGNISRRNFLKYASMAGLGGMLGCASHIRSTALPYIRHGRLDDKFVQGDAILKFYDGGFFKPDVLMVEVKDDYSFTFVDFDRDGYIGNHPDDSFRVYSSNKDLSKVVDLKVTSRYIIESGKLANNLFSKTEHKRMLKEVNEMFKLYMSYFKLSYFKR